MQRAIEAPHDSLEPIWTEYVTFENQTAAGGSAGAKTLSRELISRTQTKYMNSKKAYAVRTVLYQDVDRAALAVPQGESEELDAQFKLWKKILVYERSNPLMLETPQHLAEMLLVQSQALLYLRHYIEVREHVSPLSFSLLAALCVSLLFA